MAKDDALYPNYTGNPQKLDPAYVEGDDTVAGATDYNKHDDEILKHQDVLSNDIFHSFDIEGTTIVASENSTTLNIRSGAGILLEGDNATKTVTISATAGTDQKLFNIIDVEGIFITADALETTLNIRSGAGINFSANNVTKTITISSPESDSLAWLKATPQTGITGDKTGSFNLTTSGSYNLTANADVDTLSLGWDSDESYWKLGFPTQELEIVGNEIGLVSDNCITLQAGENISIYGAPLHLQSQVKIISETTPNRVIISGGALTSNASYILADTENSSSSDDLDTISGAGTGQILFLRAYNTDRTVVVKNGTGNIKLKGSDFTMDDIYKTIFLQYDNSYWCEIGRSSYDDGIVTTGITDNNLTASKPIFTDSNKELTSTGIGTSSQFIKGDGSLDSLQYVPQSSSRMAVAVTDFIAVSSSLNPPWTGGTLGGGTLTTALSPTSQHPGIDVIKSGTTGSLNGARWYTSGSPFLISGGETTEFIFELAFATNTQLLMGWTDGSTTQNFTNGVFIFVEGQSLYGQCVSSSSSTTTGTSYTVSSSWYHAKIVVNSDATRVDFYLYSENGTLLWSNYITTNIPTSAGQELMHAFLAMNKTATSATSLCYLDYMNISIDRELIR